MENITDDNIREFINSDESTLLVTGARQTGKTSTIKNSLKELFIPYIEINLIKQKSIALSLSKCNDVAQIERCISGTTKKELLADTVIFIDEAQDLPEMIRKITNTKRKKRFRYIFASSRYLGECKTPRLTLNPLSFVEFAASLGTKQDMIDHIEDCYKNDLPVDKRTHKKMLDMFYLYLIVGGIPSCVVKLINKDPLSEIYTEQNNIINRVKSEFIRYERREKKLRINSIYDNIPDQLSKDYQKFVYNLLDRELKFNRYQISFDLMEDSAACIFVHKLTQLKLPLNKYVKPHFFKLFLNDTGLYSSYFSEEQKDIFLKNPDESTISLKGLFASFVAQQLNQNGIKAYYYKEKNHDELDFVYEDEGTIHPLLVSTNYQTDARDDIPDKVIFYRGNTACHNNVKYYPIYMAGFVKLKEQ